MNNRYPNGYPSIAELRNSGYRVYVNHYMFSEPLLMRNNKYTKGITTVSLVSPYGDELFGYSSCALSDNFNRRLGVSIALGRALTCVN